VLWPFAFHCTGMPINAAANRLKSEISQNLHVKRELQGTQFSIMKQMGIPEEDIPKFQDPVVWLHYFSPLSRDHLKKFGVHVDWRRSFITTEYNPYYDSFIEWQFQVLREQGRVVFGKRPSIFSVKDNQICADHDRSEGEGVNPQEYTIIKIQVKNKIHLFCSIS
jgi:leucyl-tRNA synthetase